MPYTDENITALVRSNFPALTEPRLIEAMQDVGTIMAFPAGEIIMDYGSYIRNVPLVIEGSIKVTREDDRDGREILLYFLSAGDTCSMSFTCCMSDKRSVIRTEALEDTRLLAIPVKYVDEWMMQYRSWKNFVMSSYDLRMQELVEVIDSITFSNLDNRLVDYLHARRASTGSDVIKAVHREIALDLNASREAVSRLLKKLEQMNKIELGRNTIKILSSL